jgi:hypothetical protein
MLDEYGYSHRSRGGLCIKVNLTRLSALWRKLKRPTKADWGTRCEEAKKRDAEFESWFSRPTKGDTK